MGKLYPVEQVEARENTEHARQRVNMVATGHKIESVYGPEWTLGAGAQFRADLLAILALPPVKQSDGWQDISTAPKDGTPFIIVDAMGLFDIGVWHNDHVCGEANGAGPWTHWQPLPAPPGQQSDDRTIEHSSIVAERVRDGLEQIATASEDTEASVLRYIAKATLDAFTAGNSLLEGGALGLAERVREALVECDAAIKEMFRYYDGGETRGSYDGKPERAQLRKAGYAAASAIRSLDITRMDSDG